MVKTQRTIEVTIETGGNIQIEGIGFQGADCEKATKFLEEALGTVSKRVKKPEYNQRSHSKAHQRLGS
jgi:hypothetical protein